MRFIGFPLLVMLEGLLILALLDQTIRGRSSAVKRAHGRGRKICRARSAE
jgi:hypothetical protein